MFSRRQLRVSCYWLILVFYFIKHSSSKLTNSGTSSFFQLTLSRADGVLTSSMLVAESQIIVNASQFLHKSFQSNSEARLAVSLIAFSGYGRLAGRVGKASCTQPVCPQLWAKLTAFKRETNIGGFTNKTLIKSVSFKHALLVAVEYGDANGFSRLDVMF
jgi:hypothetical protein